LARIETGRIYKVNKFKISACFFWDEVISKSILAEENYSTAISLFNFCVPILVDASGLIGNDSLKLI